MKMTHLKSGLLYLLLIAATSFSFVACDDDDENTTEDLKSAIVGNWEITSFKVGGSEYMNNTIDSASIEYEAYTGTKGDFTQKVKYKDEFPEESIDGNYQVIDGNEIKMTSDGETYLLEATINGDHLQLEGVQDGKPLLIKANRVE